MADLASYRPRPGSIPTDSGVYRFFDAFGNIIYVGKTKNLCSRLNLYPADPLSLHFRTQTVVRTVARVEWTVVANELEAFRLEYIWIQQFDPWFNVRYRDNKSYLWLAVTWNETYPRVFVGRDAKRRGTRHFGPFGQAWAIRETVDALLRVFPMRSCTDGVLKRAKASGCPYLLGDIEKCSAPCVGRAGSEEHRGIADGFCCFMAGEPDRTVQELECEMLEAFADLNFERAAVLHDQLVGLAETRERNTVVLPETTRADVVGFADDDQQVAVQIFHVRGGRIMRERGWIADRSDDRGLAESLEPFLFQLYIGENPPPPLVLSSVPAEPELVALLEGMRGMRAEVRVPVRGDKRTLLGTVLRNAELSLQQQVVRRASDLITRNRMLEETANALGLAKPPLRIEYFDIPHTQGIEVVGPVVVFEDSLARKSDYRWFVIKSFKGSNDVAAMDEMLSRRLGRLLDERCHGEDEAGSLLVDPTMGASRKFSYAPVLIVVDGGAPQATAATRALEELGLAEEIALCGLVKRPEEVWLPGEEYPVILPHAPEGFYLPQRVHDEAHQFVITHRRGRCSKAMLSSALDVVPGLGKMCGRVLISHFGSSKKLRGATPREIATVPGIGPKLAAAVHKVVSGIGSEVTNLTTGEITFT